MGASWSTPKCKLLLRTAIQRLTMSINHHQHSIQFEDRRLVTLLREAKDESARIQVEVVMQYHQRVHCMEAVKVMCELLMTRLTMIEHAKTCPPDLIEAIATVVYCASRLDIPELGEIAKQFGGKFGADTIKPHQNNDSGKVNPHIVQRLRIEPPSIESVIDYMVALAKKNDFVWTPHVAVASTTTNGAAASTSTTAAAAAQAGSSSGASKTSDSGDIPELNPQLLGSIAKLPARDPSSATAESNVDELLSMLPPPPNAIGAGAVPSAASSKRTRSSTSSIDANLLGSDAVSSSPASIGTAAAFDSPPTAQSDDVEQMLAARLARLSGASSSSSSGFSTPAPATVESIMAAAHSEAMLQRVSLASSSASSLPASSSFPSSSSSNAIPFAEANIRFVSPSPFVRPEEAVTYPGTLNVVVHSAQNVAWPPSIVATAPVVVRITMPGTAFVWTSTPVAASVASWSAALQHCPVAVTAPHTLVVVEIIVYPHGAHEVVIGGIAIEAETLRIAPEVALYNCYDKTTQKVSGAIALSSQYMPLQQQLQQSQQLQQHGAHAMLSVPTPHRQPYHVFAPSPRLIESELPFGGRTRTSPQNASSSSDSSTFSANGATLPIKSRSVPHPQAHEQHQQQQAETDEMLCRDANGVDATSAKLSKPFSIGRMSLSVDVGAPVITTSISSSTGDISSNHHLAQTEAESETDESPGARQDADAEGPDTSCGGGGGTAAEAIASSSLP